MELEARGEMEGERVVVVVTPERGVAGGDDGWMFL